MRKLCVLIVAIVLTLALVQPLLAGDKIRVAVVDFNTEALRNNWHYSGWYWHDLSKPAADNLATELVKTGSFTVIERQQLDEILAEQNLGASGRVDASTAASIGKILGVQLIIIGSVEEFGVSEWGGKVPQVGKWKWGRGVGGKMYHGKAKLNARMVDTTTAEILAAYEAEGDKKFGSGEFAGADFGKKMDTGMVSKVLSAAVQDLAAKISESAGGITPSTPVQSGLSGKIARADGGSTVYVNLGSADGVKVGTQMKVYRVGEEIIDPDTGQSLGGIEELVGAITITKVVNDKLSIASVTDGSGMKVGDLVKSD